MTDRVSQARALPLQKSAWRRIRGFSLRDWRDLAEAGLTLAAAHAALRFRSPARVIARATAEVPTRAASFTDARVKRVAWLVGVAGRHLVPVPCLSRTVALARVMARRGVRTEIRVGVRTIDGRLDAHAWVVLDGRPLNDDEATVGRYAPFARPLGELADVRSLLR